MTSWRTGFAKSGGERIYWECAGVGEPVVICHGAGSNHVSFFQQVTGLASGTRQVVLWDRRGCGNSTRGSGGVSIAAAVADLDAVLDAVGLGTATVHLAGQALGGMVAAAWALAHPARAATLALWDGPFGLSDDRRSIVWKLEPDDAGVAAGQVDRQVSRTRAVGRQFQDGDPVGAYLYQTIQELGTARPSYQENFAAGKSAAVPVDGLVGLDIPVLIGRGEFDHIVGHQPLAEIAALIPRATMKTLAGGGHSPYFEIPDAWNAAMRAHIDSAGCPPAGTQLA